MLNIRGGFRLRKVGGICSVFKGRCRMAFDGRMNVMEEVVQRDEFNGI